MAQRKSPLKFFKEDDLKKTNTTADGFKAVGRVKKEEPKKEKEETKKEEAKPVIKPFIARVYIPEDADQEEVDQIYKDAGIDDDSDDDDYFGPSGASGTYGMYRDNDDNRYGNHDSVYECYYCGSEDCTRDGCDNFPLD